MTTPLELYAFPWGVSPRRVFIYLTEKNLLTSPHIKITDVTWEGPNGVAPGKPPGSLPMLRLPDGQFIKESIAIIDYLEDICDAPDPSQPWQVELAAQGRGTMRGATPARRARNRDMLCMADAATNHMFFVGHKGVKLFEQLEEVNPAASRLGKDFVRKNMARLEGWYAEELPLLVEGKRGVTTADCVVFSLLDFYRTIYDFDVAEGLESIQGFYEFFGKRESARIPEGRGCPEPIAGLARIWLPEEAGKA